MLATFYLCLTILFGISVVLKFVNVDFIYEKIGSKEIARVLPKLLFIIPTGIIIGMILGTCFNYYLILILNKLFPTLINSTYNIGIIITFILFLVLTFYNFHNIKIQNYKYSKKNILLFVIIVLLLTLLTSFLMFYTYHIKDNYLYVGGSTYSDMSPHTAMTSSFGIGSNIPTSYMHFAEDGIRYHFFFYFFAGILKYLGFSISLAINIPSILAMTSALTLVGLLSCLIAKSKKAFIIAPILVLFRSSLNFFYLVSDIFVDNAFVFKRLLNLSEWYQVTPYDDWGIWAINVYPNQRHLMLGVSFILIMIFFFLPYIVDWFNRIKRFKIKNKIKKTLFSKEAWIINKNDCKLLMIILLTISLMPYFHGSALIGCLVILFGMAIISSKKLMYLIVATTAIISSFIQTRILSGGASNVIGLHFEPGFVVEDKSLGGILSYIFIITGFTIALAFLYSILKRKEKRYLIYITIAFCLPFIFAFLFQVSLEMLANHKFIQFSIILLDILVGALIANILRRKKNLNIIISIILIFNLTCTGIAEWITYININKDPVMINLDSELTKWIKENTNKDDIFLTPIWAMTEFNLTGRGMYYGWPYYAWSAGYDTDLRGKEYEALITGMDDDIDAFRTYCIEHKIKYLIDTEDYLHETYSEGIYYHQWFLENNLELVKYFPETNIAVYKIY